MGYLSQARTVTTPRGSRPSEGHAFPGWWTLMWQAALFAAAAVCYFGVRDLTEGARDTAIANAESVVRLEGVLGIDWERAMQERLIEHSSLVTLANWIYIYGHWPVLIAALTWLFVRHPPDFYLLRNALFISGAIGLVIFVLFPVAPPRLGVLDIVDTVTQRSSSYRTLQPPGLVNRYAAVPSLHFGWNLLVGIMVWRVTRQPAMRALAVLMVVAMGLAVIVTANHYIFDVVAGAAVALTGLAGAMLLPRVRRTPAWAVRRG
jgi:hypothetical protein